MPEFVTGRAGALGAAAFGFCGKLPARGDFVSAGLPRRFVDPWHDWLQAVIAGSRDLLGEGWLPAWLEAPVWRFALPAGLCGPDGVLGLWLPSVDRAGRHFPLTVAAVTTGADLDELTDAGIGFLERAEAAGIAALERDLVPEELSALLAEPAARNPAANAACDGVHRPRLVRSAGAAAWWSAGSPRVPAGAFTGATLPDAAVFARMLDSGAAGAPPGAGR